MIVLALLFVVTRSMVYGEDKKNHTDDAKHVTVRPDAIKWGPAPPGLPPGVQMAVLVGDPTKPGVPYVVRAKMPDGYRVPPHWHPHDENVTVLQGTMLMGEGEKFDPEHAMELSAGSFTRMPKTMRHFAMAKGETIIQLHGIGPFAIIYVNPADDPRKKEDK
jgi:quercetin dioxygenase-like cupin family protein